MSEGHEADLWGMTVDPNSWKPPPQGCALRAFGRTFTPRAPVAIGLHGLALELSFLEALGLTPGRTTRVSLEMGLATPFDVPMVVRYRHRLPGRWGTHIGLAYLPSAQLGPLTIALYGLLFVPQVVTPELQQAA